MYNFSPSLNLISVTSRKKLLSIATLSALALMSGAASAVTEGNTITDQAGFENIGLNGTNTSDVFFENAGKTGIELSGSPSHDLQIKGNNNNNVLLKAKDVLHLQATKDASQSISLSGMKNLTLEGTQHAVYVNTNNTSVHLGRSGKNGQHGEDTSYLKTLTLKGGDEGHALYVKTGDKWKVVEDPDKEMDEPLNKADVRIYAEKTTLETTGKIAVRLEGKWNDQNKKFDTHPDIEFFDIKGVYQTLNMKGSEFSIDARNGASMTVRNEEVYLDGGVHVSKNAWVDIGYRNKKLFPDNWEQGFIIGDADQEVLDKVTVNAKGGKAALEFDNGGLLSIGAKNVSINAENGVAISVKTTGDSYESDDSVVDIYAEDTLTIKGDIEIDTTKGIGKQGYINIGGKKVVMVGDISLKATEANAQAINIDLDGEGSSFTGTITEEIVPNEQAQAVTFAFFAAAQQQSSNGVNMALSNGATYNATGDSTIKNIEANGGTINAGNSKVTVKNLNTGANGATFKATSVKDEQIHIVNNKGNGPTAFEFDLIGQDANVTAQDVAKAVKVDNNQNTTLADVSVQTNLGNFTAKLNLNNQEVTNEEFVTSNVLLSLNDIASNQMLAWRAQINDVSKRMGDLRTYDTMSGGWVRMFGSRSEYGDRNMDNKSTTLQVGTDRRVAGNGYVGLTAHYSEGDGDLVNGSTEDKAYGFGIYGGWMADDGQFVDVILKRTRMDTDYKLKYTTGTESNGNFHTWGTSLAMEYGWRLACDKTPFWIEPQAEVTYGHLEGVDYTTSAGVKAHQEGMDSLVGRLGLSVGYTKDANTVYAKASVAHEFEGESSATMRSGQSLTLEQDIGGTWGEVAVGGTVRLNKSIAAYGEFQTTFGSPVETPYQWNVGVRYLW